MLHGHLVSVYDIQQAKHLQIALNLSLHLLTAYPSRFSLSRPTDNIEELQQMARLAAKSPVKYQRRYTLAEVADKELSIVSIEERAGDYGIYLLCKFDVKGTPDTGYLSMGLPQIVEALKKLDWKKDLPGEVKFTKSGANWIME